MLAYNAPRFVLDFHLAGGLLGHLRLGLVTVGGPSKWLDEFDDIVASYIDGHMEYRLRDGALAGVEIRRPRRQICGVGEERRDQRIARCVADRRDSCSVDPRRGE